MRRAEGRRPPVSLILISREATCWVKNHRSYRGEIVG